MPPTLLEQAQAELARRQAAGGTGTPAAAPTAPAAPAAGTDQQPPPIPEELLHSTRSPQDQALAEMARRQQEVHPFKALSTGLRNAGESLAGAGADLTEAEIPLVIKLMKMMGADDQTIQSATEYLSGGPALSSMNTEAVKSYTDAAVNKVLPEEQAAAVKDFTRHEAQNTAERRFQTAGEFIPMIAAPETALSKLPGKIITKTAPRLVEATPGVVKSLGTAATKVAVPATVTEGAGEAAHAACASPAVENAVRIVAGFLSSGGIEQGVKMRLDREVKAIVDAGPAAIKSVFDNLTAQHMSAEQAAAKMREMGLPGVDAMLLDTGTNTVQQAQNIHAQGGPGRAIIEEPLRARDPKINEGLETKAEGVVGPRKQPSVVEQALQEKLDEATRQQSASHVNQVQDVDLQGMAHEIDARIANEKDPGLISKLQTVRKLLDAPEARGGGLETTSAQALKVRQAIKGMIWDAKGQIRDINDTELGALKELYARTNKAIEPANPSLRAADAGIEQVKKEGEAFVEGQKVYQNKPAHEGGITEVEFKQNFDKMTPGEQQALMDGVNVETWRQLGINANNLVKLKDLVKGDGKWNHQKLAGIYGEEKVQGMMDALENAKQLRENTREIVHGSKTASATAMRDKKGTRSAGQAISDAVPEVAGAAAIDVLSGSGGAVTTAAALNNVKRFIVEKLAGGEIADPALSDQAARVLKMNDPDKVMELGKILATREQLGGGVKSPVLAALLARQTDVSDRKEKR